MSTAFAADSPVRPRNLSLPWLLLVAGVGLVAFAVRLLPVLHGGGLYGLGNYDDGVYYGAAVGVVHGRLPYRDFLLLHPPGIVLALAPFAAVGRLWGDPVGFAAARLAWMVLGALNAVLVSWVVRPVGRAAALLGGLAYALFLPAIYGEHTTLLESPANTCLLLAVALLTVGGRKNGPLMTALAGAAVGASAGFKIWGVVTVLLVAGWVLLSAGPRRAIVLVLGAVAGVTAVCLPFFLAAPGAMFRMVVLDQLGRPRLGTSMVTRVSQLLGLGDAPGGQVSGRLVVVAVAVVVLAVLAAWTSPGRLAVTLLAGLTAMLLLTPTWFPHYATVFAAPGALTFGYGTASLLTRLRRSWVHAAAALGLAGLLVTYALPVFALQYNHPFPGRALAAAVTRHSGCVTSDDDTTLVEMDVLGRNLNRGCVLVVDLGGHSYDEPGHPLSRQRDPVWQRYALSYLETGSAIIVSHFSAKRGFSTSTVATISRWRVLHRVGRYVLRQAHAVHPT